MFRRQRPRPTRDLPSRRRRPALGLAAAALLVGGLGLAGCQEKEPQTIGEHLDAAIEKADRQLEEAGQKLEEKFDDEPDTIGEHIDEGLESLKEGAQEVARWMEETAESWTGDADGAG